MCKEVCAPAGMHGSRFVVCNVTPEAAHDKSGARLIPHHESSKDVDLISESQGKCVPHSWETHKTDSYKRRLQMRDTCKPPRKDVLIDMYSIVPRSSCHDA